MPLILSLLPIIFPVAEKAFGAVISSEAKGSIIGKLGEAALGDNPVGSISSVFATVLGNISSEQQHEFELELQSILGQINLDEIEEARSKWNPREIMFWVIVAIFSIHYGLIEGVNLANSLFHLNLLAPAPLDNLFLIMATGFCGFHIAASTIEKLND